MSFKHNPNVQRITTAFSPWLMDDMFWQIHKFTFTSISRVLLNLNYLNIYNYFYNITSQMNDLHDLNVNDQYSHPGKFPGTK